MENQGRASRARDRRGGSSTRAAFSRPLRVLLWGLVGLLVAAAGAAEGQGEGPVDPAGSAERPAWTPRESPAGAQASPQGPGLDALLHVPSRVLENESSSVAGTSEDEWRRRFQKARSELEGARSGLEQTKRELDSVAEGGGANQWSVAPPGGGSTGAGTTSPLSFKLRQELKRKRERLETAERALRELRIEADLAGVPSTWRGEPTSEPMRSLPN